MMLPTQPPFLTLLATLVAFSSQELAAANQRKAERTGSRGGTAGLSRGGSRGGLSSRAGSSRGGSRGGTASSRRPGTSGSVSSKSRTIKAPENKALAGLSVMGSEKLTSARPSSADPRNKMPKGQAGLTPLEQLKRARKVTAPILSFVTLCHCC